MWRFFLKHFILKLTFGELPMVSPILRERAGVFDGFFETKHNQIIL